MHALQVHPTLHIEARREIPELKGPLGNLRTVVGQGSVAYWKGLTIAVIFTVIFRTQELFEIRSPNPVQQAKQEHQEKQEAGITTEGLLLLNYHR